MRDVQMDSGTSITPPSSIELNCLLEKNTFPHQKVGEIFGMLQISSNSPIMRNIQSLSSSPSYSPVDFVVVIDVSSSMKDQNKLAHVQGAIEYMINRLIQEVESNSSPSTVPHRFCLIQFNDYAEVVTDGFVNLIPQNRDSLLSSLRTLRPGGSTNISQALFCALEIVSTSLERNQFIIGNSDSSSMKGTLANIMFLTDGLANSGLRGEEFINKVKNFGIPSQITINTFGFGQDHDSLALKTIAMASSGGVYYYVPQPVGILSAFAEAISGAMRVRANDILVNAVAHDGCRIVEWFSTLPVQVNKSCKDYLFTFGTARESETRTLLFKLSLRNMDKEMESHPLITFRVTLVNSLTGTPETHQITGSVSRPCYSLSKYEEKRPFDLDEQINRWSTASAIQRTAELVSQSLEYISTAQKEIVSVLSQIRESISSDSKFCQQMEADLKRVGSAIGSCTTVQESNPAIHLCHVLSTMHYVERSAGMRSCISPRGIFYSSFLLSNDSFGSFSSLSAHSSTFSSPSFHSGQFSLRSSSESGAGSSSDADLASAVLRLDTKSCSDLNKKFNLQGDQSGFFFTSLGSLNEAAESDPYFVSYQREEIALARVQASKLYEHYIRRNTVSKTTLASVSSGSFSDSSTEICRKRSSSGAPVVRKKLSCSQEGIQVAAATSTTTPTASTGDFVVNTPSIAT
eukprot:TRINITY_DN15287_c0_g1_i1.p1 TRINITY_DN15287_c0_g1~~TRINITY_DN15287_c0_g1_i1.p1  ORF type:complete len:688 (-),score=163.21 TRINITY_DN15287_c0_g1_i1:41-2104(-)